MNNLENKPSIGFFPGFFDIGETYPLVKIAKRYEELGGKVTIFSHGGEYEYLVKEQGFKITRIQPLGDRSSMTKYFLEKSDEEIIKMIKDQVIAYKESDIKALVQTCSYLDCLITPRLARIPIISVFSGTLAPPYFKANYATFPDSSENLITRFIPKIIKNKFSKWYSLNYRGPITKKFNRIAKETGINTRFGCFQDIMFGSHTLMCDDMEFLGLKPIKNFPAENYIGPILSFDPLEQKEIQDNEVKNHLKRPGKSILLTMGGSYLWKPFFLRFLKILNQTGYNVIATYTSILKEKELPKVNDNILLKKYVKNITELNQEVDLAIIHGGRGSVYTAAYSNKPSVGIPYNGEQQYNLDSLVRHGVSIRLSKTFFQDNHLLRAINEIFNNYDSYLKNAQTLNQKLAKPEGDKNAARRILELLTN